MSGPGKRPRRSAPTAPVSAAGTLTTAFGKQTAAQVEHAQPDANAAASGTGIGMSGEEHSEPAQKADEALAAAPAPNAEEADAQEAGRKKPDEEHSETAQKDDEALSAAPAPDAIGADTQEAGSELKDIGKRDEEHAEAAQDDEALSAAPAPDAIGADAQKAGSELEDIDKPDEEHAATAQKDGGAIAAASAPDDIGADAEEPGSEMKDRGKPDAEHSEVAQEDVKVAVSKLKDNEAMGEAHGSDVAEDHKSGNGVVPNAVSDTPPRVSTSAPPTGNPQRSHWRIALGDPLGRSLGGVLWVSSGSG